MSIDRIPLHHRAPRLLTSAVIAALVLLTTVVAAPPAHAASRGSGFGDWAPISAYGYHGSMLIDGVHTYCILPGVPLPTGPSTDHGASTTAAGLSPQQLTGINLLVTKYGQTDDPVQAAAVGWAVKAIANWSDTLHHFGYRGDSLAGAINWTFSALAPEHNAEVQRRATAFYDEAARVGVPDPRATLVLSTDAADHRRGTVRVDASPPAATGSIALVNAVFADTGSAERDGVTPGVEYAIQTVPPTQGRPYSASGTARLTGGYAAAVRHFTTPGGQDTAGPAGPAVIEAAGSDAVPRVAPFAPAVTPQVVHGELGEAFIDDVTFTVAEGEWPRGEDGSFLPVTAHATVYRTVSAPGEGLAIPADAVEVGTLWLASDSVTGPTEPYRVTSEWTMDEPGVYTAVWTITAESQTAEVGARLSAGFRWTEAFGVPSQVVEVVAPPPPPPPPPPPAEETSAAEAHPAPVAQAETPGRVTLAETGAGGIPPLRAVMVGGGALALGVLLLRRPRFGAPDSIG